MTTVAEVLGTNTVVELLGMHTVVELLGMHMHSGTELLEHAIELLVCSIWSYIMVHVCKWRWDLETIPLSAVLKISLYIINNALENLNEIFEDQFKQGRRNIEQGDFSSPPPNS